MVNEDSDYVITGSTQKLSNFRDFTGDFDYTYTYNDVQVNKKFAAACEYSYGGTVVTSVDYLGVSADKIDVFSKAMYDLYDACGLTFREVLSAIELGLAVAG